MQSKATTVKQYLQELPEDRRRALEAVRKVILSNADKNYEEGMQYGMIGYYVPHSVYPDGYHCDPRQPVPFACLASQKNHMSLYLMSAYGEGLEEDWFRKAWAKTGKKLDMGKCCIRFKRLDDLALEVIGEAVRRVPAHKYIAAYDAFLKSSGRKKSATSAAGKSSRAKPSTGTRRQAAAKSKPNGKRSARRKVKA
jgi:hypothetical protein